MKKALSIVLALLMLLAMIPASLAQETAPVVYVTIADQGLKLVQRPIVLHDTDNDGVLTIADALYLAHEEGYEGGAAAGFATQMGDYGLSITRLWGVENGGAYGYYVNNQMSMGLSDVLIVTEAVDQNLYLAARNLPHVDVRDVQGTDPVSLIAFDKVLVTVSAVKKFEELLA